jgi:hypothetical protein
MEKINKTITCTITEAEFLQVLKLRTKLNKPISKIMRDAMKVYIESNK